jgi:hypothetical protein
MFQRRNLDDPRSPLTQSARTTVVLGAIAAAPVVYLVDYLGAGLFDPLVAYIVGGTVSAAAIVAVILLQLRGPRDWYVRCAAWGLLLVVLWTSYVSISLAAVFSSDSLNF